MARSLLEVYPTMALDQYESHEFYGEKMTEICQSYPITSLWIGLSLDIGRKKKSGNLASRAQSEEVDLLLEEQPLFKKGARTPPGEDEGEA